ncbi:MAG: DeoR/GlpR transcriptional regulator [Clostridia bacterium]|nr:DeoR/GlpR transcriptional regulator [Clostridia bacterium]
MLAIERRNAISELLAARGKVIVSELAKEFSVTEETIRRDLDKLEKEGIATKTYGGAVSGNSSVTDVPYRVRLGVNVDKKKAIAEKVATLIKDGQRIMLDASSTAIYVTRAIKNKSNITVITNSVEILLELADKSDWTVFSTGGVLKEGALSLTGSSAERMIRGYHVDIAVCSCKGIDVKFGITDSNEKDAQIKQAVFASADRRVLALDSDKFDRKSFVKVCEISEVDTVVTDSRPSDTWVEYLAAGGVEVIY